MTLLVALYFQVLLGRVEDLVCLHLQIADFLVLDDVGYERILEMVNDEVSVGFIVYQDLSLVSLSLVAGFGMVGANSNAGLIDCF